MKFDYSNRYKFNKNNKQEKEEIINEEVEEKEEVVEEHAEEAVEENLIDIEDEKTEEDLADTEADVLSIEEKLEPEKYGNLVNCELLNGRKEPDPNSEIILIIKKEDEIKILEELDEFYKVSINNKEVYCMKKFIEIK